MTLGDLPTELILHVAKFLDYASEIDALARTNHWFFTILDPLLYSTYSQEEDNLALRWAASHGSAAANTKLLATGTKPTTEAVLLAATFGHGRIIALLHEKGADINAAVTVRYPDDISYEDTGHECEFKGTPLGYAVKKGHEPSVRVLVDLGANIDCLTYDGYMPTPLIELAAPEGPASVMKILIDAARKANSADLGPQLIRALSVAALYGNVPVVQVLLDAGTDVNEEHPAPDPRMGERSYELPIFAAVSSGSRDAHLEVVRVLLDAGASLSATRADGWTPVSVAAIRGRLAVAKFLLETGDRPHVRAVFYLLRQNRRDMLELLLPSLDLPQLAQDESSRAIVLTIAAGFGLLPVVADLISQGWNVDGPPAVGLADMGGEAGYPLVWAARYGHLDVFRLLLEHGADPFGHPRPPNARTTMNILTAAVRGGNAEIVSILLDRGADVNPTEGEDSILFLAVAYGSESVFKVLLEGGADPKVRGERRMSLGGPNSLASKVVRKGTAGMVRLMCERGIDFNHVSFVPHSHDSIEEPRNVLQLLAKRDMSMVHVLVEHGFNLDPTGTDAKSGLLAAVRAGNIPYIRFLLDRGFNPRTPGLEVKLLCSAALLKAPSDATTMLDLLLREGLDLEAQNDYGQTALSYGIAGKFLNAPEHTVPLLLSRGANPIPIGKGHFAKFPLQRASTYLSRGPLEALLGAIAMRNIPFDKVEAQLREAIETFPDCSQRRDSLKMMRRFYWRHKHPCH